MEQVKRTRTSGLPALLALATLLAALRLDAQQPGPQIMPNYREADLRQVVEAVGEVTGRNFLVDPRVTGQVTFLSYSPMSPEAFYEAFLATLQIHGFIAVESENVVRIVPDATARVHPGLAAETEGDRIVTQVVQLTNVGAAQLVPILRPPDSAVRAPGSAPGVQHADHCRPRCQRRPNAEHHRPNGSGLGRGNRGDPA